MSLETKERFLRDTHERSFQHVFGHENLVGGVEYTGLKGALLDLGHAVEAGRENHHQCGAHRGHHDGATATFNPIEGDDDEFSERSFENEGENQKHFAENCSIE